MDNQDKSRVAKTVGDLCGSLTCFSVGFAVFVIVFWFTVEDYNVEVWPVVSIMIGIALGCLFTRVSLLLSHCPDCTPHDIFKPLIWPLILFVGIGVIFGWYVQFPYNEHWAERLCDDVMIGVEANSTDSVMVQCLEYTHNMQLWIHLVLMAATLFLAVYAVIFGWYKLRWGRSAE